MSILDDLIQDEPNAAPKPDVAPIKSIGSDPGGNILDTLLQSSQELHQQHAVPTEGVASDITKSAAIGVPKAIIGAAGMPGDVLSLVQPTQEQAQAVTAPNLGFLPGRGLQEYLPTSRGIQSAIETVTGPFYKPKTTPGKFAEATTEFVANPLTYLGPGSAALKAGTAATSALASEAAGQATEGLGPLETAARITGGLIGGHIPNSVNKAVTRSALRNAATTEDLFNASSHLYENSYTSGVSIRPQVGRDWAYNISSDLRSDGFRPYTEASRAAFKTIGELGRVFNNQGTLGIAEIDTVRKALNKIAMGADPTARAIARYGISKIDENVSNLSNNPNWLATGHQNAEQVSKDITSARATYAAGMRSNMLEDAFESALEKAERRAGSTGKGGNIENTMRQEIRKIIESRTKRAGFNSDEIQTMEDIVKGTTKTNLLRGIGALAPTGIVSGTLGLELGHILFHGAGMFGVPLVGAGAKKLGEIQTRRAIEEVAARTRLRGAGAPQPSEYTPATGYRFPLFGSTLGTNQSKGGRALRLANQYRRKK